MKKNKQMETFDLESHLKGAYSSFPEAKRQPLIGISANYEGIDATLRDRYYKLKHHGHTAGTIVGSQHRLAPIGTVRMMATVGRWVRSIGVRTSRIATILVTVSSLIW